MKNKKTGGEWLDHFQSKIKNYCEKQMISKIHKVQMIFILSKAWNKAFELGYVERIKDESLYKLDYAISATLCNPIIDDIQRNKLLLAFVSWYNEQEGSKCIANSAIGRFNIATQK